MADKNIQMQRKNADGSFDKYYPLTKAANVDMADGTTVEDKVTAHLADLASQAVNKGASLVGIDDAGNLLAATNVEGALQELAARPQRDLDNGRYQADFGFDGAVLFNASVVDNTLSLHSVEYFYIAPPNTSASGVSDKRGIRITPTKTGTFTITATLMSGSGATKGYFNGTQVNVVNGQITFTLAVTSGVNVDILVDNAGASYTAQQNSNTPTPLYGDNFTIVSGLYGTTSSTTSTIYSIESLSIIQDAALGVAVKAITDDNIQEWGNLKSTRVVPPNTSAVCDVEEVILNSSITGTSNAFIYGTTNLVGIKFTPDSDTNKLQVLLKLFKSGAIASDLSVHVYSDNSGVPGISLGSSVILNPDITTTYRKIPTAISGLSLIGGQPYHIVLKTTSGNGSNYIAINLKTGITSGNYEASTNSGTSWSSNDTISCWCVISSPIKSDVPSVQDLSDIDSSLYQLLQVRWTLTRNSLSDESPKVTNQSLTWKGSEYRDNTWVEIGELSVGSGSGVQQMDMSDIPDAYKSLRLTGRLFFTCIASSVLINLRFNNDSGTNYLLQSGPSSSSSLVNGIQVAATYPNLGSPEDDYFVVELYNLSRNKGKRGTLLTSRLYLTPPQVDGSYNGSFAWINTSSDITQISVVSMNSSIKMLPPSKLTLWGCK